MSGSPPQVRGKHSRVTSVLSYPRITPAGAGKTYPPPWGLLSVRITPAGAGKTPRPVSLESCHRDHPRRCGENCTHQCHRACTTGSPPQVRGKLRQSRLIRCVGRITPAGAGKTISSYNPASTTADHPRRCGENRRRRALPPTLPGSPPQVRGKPRLSLPHPDSTGITPAGAGKTSPCRIMLTRFQDHPRRCGENRFTGCHVSTIVGSPPQVRGKQAYSLPRIEPLRITPAGAGKTVRKCFIEAVGKGSPPQVRGKRTSGSDTLLADRITPAGAGKTNVCQSLFTSD